jgi:Fic family protein
VLAAGPGKFEGGMTPGEYFALTKAKYLAANRDLVDLVAKKLLVRKGAGRSTRICVKILGGRRDVTDLGRCAPQR